MQAGEKADPHDRSSTDEGLRLERERTDAELGRHSKAVQEDASDVVAQAREQADTVLSAARDREDSDRSAGPAVEHERAREDAVLESARTDADAVLEDERERRQRALASLLASEREYTDLRLESERERVDQALTSREDLMAMVSHELRNLLGGVALGAELLTDFNHTTDPLEHVRTHAARIRRCTAQMTRLVGDLMDVASIDAGKLALVRVPRDARLLLRDVLDAFEPAAARAGIQLRGEIGDDVGIVELDHERMLQVLTNLVGNAFKFTPKGGQIAIRVERRGHEVCFAVSDTGCGIAPELLDKVFQRHFQSRGADRRGLGLGLFIAKSIVEGHGGSIWAESAPGEGTTIRITLPA